MSEQQKREYLEFAKKLALEAGEIMREHFLVGRAEWKEDETPLTLADTTINRMVIERIEATYPEHSVLGEEESSNVGKEYTWVCDPVDGTMPYSHGIQVASFSLALCHDGIPQIGVVFDPFMKRLFEGALGGGSYCNGEQLKVSQSSMKNALIDISAFPSTRPVVDVDSRVMTDVFYQGAKVTSLWSCILPSCLIAQGYYGGVVLNYPSPHDSAAIKVIVEEAGGRVTDLYGNDQRYDQPTKGFIASNGVIHETLVEIVKGAKR